MPAARYWRAIGLQTYGGAALELSALHLYLSGVRVDASATLSSAIAPSFGALANLQDGSTSTVCRWDSVSANGFALSWDFGSAQGVDALRLGSGALQSEYLERLTLQYSSNGVTWETSSSLGRFRWPSANTLDAEPIDADPYFANVALLTHMDGANGSTVFTDSSAAHRTLTAYGSAQISTAQSKFGGASGYFNGGSYLSCPYADVFNFAGNAWCVEFFVRWSGGSADVVSRRAAGIVAAWEIKIIGAGSIYLLIGNANLSNWAFVHTFSGVNVTQNVWQHVAVCGSAGTIRAYVDGVAASNPINGSVASVGTQDLYIGRGGDAFFSGHLDELRITKGNARYADNFTPPSAPFSDISGGPAFDPLLLRTAGPEPVLILSGGNAGPTGPVLSPAVLALDQQDAGHYRLYGTVELAGTPNLLLRRRVQLWNQRDKRMVRETWSDATTGAWSFDYIRGGDGTRYSVVTYDHTGQKQAQIADNLEPEAM